MANLIYHPSLDSLVLVESDRDKSLHNYSWEDRNELLHSTSDDKETKQRLFKFLNFESKKDCGEEVVCENINPYLCKVNHHLVVYFGDDKPVFKTKTVKTCTPHYKIWKDNYKWTRKEPETYYYLDVKDKSKLFHFYCLHYKPKILNSLRR